MFKCKYCNREFVRERTLLAHSCVEKRRRMQESEKGVRIGFQTFLKYFEITQGSAKLKTYEDFCNSQFYDAFVKFGRYCVNIRCINTHSFSKWMLDNHMSKLDHWTKDKYYSEWLFTYLRKENTKDALERAIEEMSECEEITDYFTKVANSRIIHHIMTGRISPWIIYNCNSGVQFLENLSENDLKTIYKMIEPEFWQKRFTEYVADTEWCKNILRKAGL